MFCINYVVKPGDTLYSISRKFHIGIDAIMAANPLTNVYNLGIDEVLCIPVATTNHNFSNYTTYQVEENDSLGSLLEKNHINLQDLIAANDLSNIFLLPGSTLQVPITSTDDNET